MLERFNGGERRCEAGFFGRAEGRASWKVQRDRTADRDGGTLGTFLTDGGFFRVKEQFVAKMGRVK